MEYMDELTLVDIIIEQDEIGNDVQIERKTDVYVRKNVVGTKEFYNAMAVGIRPTAELQIRNVEYNNEEECIYHGKRYSIIRTIPKGKFDLVLVLGVKQGVNNNGNYNSW